MVTHKMHLQTFQYTNNTVHRAIHIWNMMTRPNVCKRLRLPWPSPLSSAHRFKIHATKIHDFWYFVYKPFETFSRFSLLCRHINGHVCFVMWNEICTVSSCSPTIRKFTFGAIHSLLCPYVGSLYDCEWTVASHIKPISTEYND